MVGQLHVSLGLDQLYFKESSNSQSPKRSCNTIEEIWFLGARGCHYLTIRQDHFNPVDSTVEESVSVNGESATLSDNKLVFANNYIVETDYVIIEGSIPERAAFPRSARKTTSNSDARKLHHDKRNKTVLQCGFYETVHRDIGLH